MPVIRKPGIPAVGNVDPALRSVLAALKENVEILTGARPGIGQIVPLSPSATTSELVAKVNELVARLNASGQ